MICQRCGYERDLDPGDRDRDPVAELMAERCVGEGGHVWSLMLCVRCGGYGTLRTIPPSDPPLGCPRCDGSGADPGRRLPR